MREKTRESERKKKKRKLKIRFRFFLREFRIFISGFGFTPEPDGFGIYHNESEPGVPRVGSGRTRKTGFSVFSGFSARVVGFRAFCSALVYTILYILFDFILFLSIVLSFYLKVLEEKILM